MDPSQPEQSRILSKSEVEKGVERRLAGRARLNEIVEYLSPKEREEIRATTADKDEELPMPQEDFEALLISLDGHVLKEEKITLNGLSLFVDIHSVADNQIALALGDIVDPPYAAIDFTGVIPEVPLVISLVSENGDVVIGKKEGDSTLDFCPLQVDLVYSFKVEKFEKKT